VAADVVAAQKRAQQRVLVGAGLVVLGCIFGGIMGVVLNLLHLTVPAVIAVIMGVIVVVIGVAMQVAGFRTIQSLKRSRS
jgi:TM2 domain-containing membrane protein YozV